MVDTEVLGYVIPKGTQIFMVRTYDFVVVVVVVGCRIPHDQESQVGEVLCIQLFFFTNQDKFFLPQKNL